MDPVTGVMAGASLLYLLGDQAYHRWWYEPPKTLIKPQEVSIPLAQEGARYPLIYGRVRVRAPILAMHGEPERDVGDVSNGWPTGNQFFRMNMFFVLGIGMDDGNGTNRTHAMWIGDNKAFPWEVATAGSEISTELNAGDPDYGQVGGRAIYWDGSAGQVSLLNDPESVLSGIFGVSAEDVPAYLKLVSIVLYGPANTNWIIGSSPNVAAYSFEASSYRDAGGYPAVGIMARIGQDSNPANVLWDLLKCTFGKLGIPVSYLDSDSFSNAATTLYGESHGYSRFIEDARSVRDHIREILQQIDGVIYFDERAQKFKLKLVRPDYNPDEVFHITKDNCSGLLNFVSSGRSDLINSVLVQYTDRANDYQDNTEPAKNPGNSLGHGQTSAHIISMPGITHAALAAAVAHRELAWLSRPQMKCRAIVDRSGINVNPGDCVKLTYQKPDISGIMFRVARVDRGTRTDGKIALDLIQDVSYVYRGRIPEPPAVADTGLVRGGVIVGLG